MLNYRYEAIDPQGQRIEGEAQGFDEREVAKGLARRGLLVQSVVLAGSPKTTVQAPPVSSRPASQPQVKPQPAPMVQTIRGRANDGQRHLVYAQLASYLRAGINPVQALRDVSGRTNNAALREALQRASQASLRGEDFSGLMLTAPGLFPEGDSGMVRAGLAGGFLPEAFDQISRRAHDNHRLNRFLRFWLWIALLNSAIGLPLVWLAAQGLLASWDAAEASGGAAGSGVSGLTSSVVSHLVWPVIPVIILGMTALIVASYILTGPRFSRARHRLSLMAPIFGKRATNESLSAFSFALSRLSKVGLPPRQAWQIAAEAVPNLVMRDKFREAGARMMETQKFSEVVGQTRLLPHEEWALLQTAEVTGDVPGTLDRVAQINLSEFDRRQNQSRFIGVVWGVLFILLGSVIGFAIFARVWYFELPKRILPEWGSLLWPLLHR